MKVFEYVIVRLLDDEKMEIISGPHAIVAEDTEQAMVKAIIERGLRDSDGIKVLVRPFAKSL